MAIVKISEKGQLVIPVSIRNILGIQANTKIRVTLSEDKTKVVLEPLPSNPIEALTGIFKEHPRSLAAELLEERKKDLEQEES